MRCVGFILITILLWLAPLTAIAAQMTVSLSAVVLSKNQCKFNTSAATLDFGQLDPLNPTVATASATIGITCRGSEPLATYLMTDDGGLNSYNLVHQSNPAQMIPYSLSLNPASGDVAKNATQNVTISGTIQGADYQWALVGLYSDTVLLDLLP